MMLPRRVQEELLDGLAATDPVAAASRRDLQRVHRVMRTRAHLVRALRPLRPPPGHALRVLELGAGDGSLLLGMARELAWAGTAVELTLLDRVALVDDATVAAYARLGWTARAATSDVFDWAAPVVAAAPAAAVQWDVVVANLFLHHFEGTELSTLLRAVAACAGTFVACEPRRGWRALAGSHLIGGLGANAVTRTDAVLSVHAGFRGRELTALWPHRTGWTLDEYAAGPFLHCFCAARGRMP